MMYGVVVLSSGSEGSMAPSTCLPTSRAATMACLTAPESPEKVVMTSLEKLVPWAGLETETTSTVAALTAVSPSSTPMAAGAPTVMPKALPSGAPKALARAWEARAVYWNSRWPAELP